MRLHDAQSSKASGESCPGSPYLLQFKGKIYQGGPLVVFPQPRVSPPGASLKRKRAWRKKEEQAEAVRQRKIYTGRKREILTGLIEKPVAFLYSQPLRHELCLGGRGALSYSSLQLGSCGRSRRGSHSRVVIVPEKLYQQGKQDIA